MKCYCGVSLDDKTQNRPKQDHVMRCKCGYSFLREQLKSLRKDLPAEFKSYAVIDDKYYRIFLRREVEVLKCRDEENKMAALGESSQ